MGIVVVVKSHSGKPFGIGCLRFHMFLCAV
jgi:hypothetical protein